MSDRMVTAVSAATAADAVEIVKGRARAAGFRVRTVAYVRRSDGVPGSWDVGLAVDAVALRPDGDGPRASGDRGPR